MEAKQYALLPPETLKRLQQATNKIGYEQDSKMKNVHDYFADKSLSEFEKWKLYEQSLLRFPDHPDPIKILLEQSKPPNRQEELVAEQPKQMIDLSKSFPVFLLRSSAFFIFLDVFELPSIV